MTSHALHGRLQGARRRGRFQGQRALPVVREKIPEPVRTLAHHGGFRQRVVQVVPAHNDGSIRVQDASVRVRRPAKRSPHRFFPHVNAALGGGHHPVHDHLHPGGIRRKARAAGERRKGRRNGPRLVVRTVDERLHFLPLDAPVPVRVPKTPRKRRAMLRQRVAIQIKMPASLANQARLERIGGARRNISPEIILQKAARLGLIQGQPHERIGQVRGVRAAAPEKQDGQEQGRNRPRK